MIAERVKFRSLSSKLLAIYVPLICVSALVLFAILEIGNHRTQRANLVKELNELVDIQNSAFADALWELDTAQIQTMLYDLNSVAYIRGAVVYDGIGEIQGTAGDVKSEPDTPDLKVEQRLIHGYASGQENLGRLVVIAHSGGIRENTIERLKVDGLIVLVLIGVLVGGTLLATRVVIGAPLDRLRAAMERATKENVREPVQWDSRDELGRVVQAFNELQRQQAEAEDALKRYQDELEDRVTTRTEEVAMKTELLKTVLDSMSEGIVAFDKDLRLIAANDHLADIRGYPKEMATEGKPFEDFIRFDVENDEFGPGDPEKILNEKIETAKQFLPHDFERQRPNGAYIEVKGGPLPGGGFVSTYADVTERKEVASKMEAQVAELDDARKATLNMMEDAEALRKRAEGLRDEAEAATKAKASFLATMSHEIRTPMNGIIGMVDMLVQTKLEDDQRQMMRTVRDSAYALLTIINDILDFSKIEAGKLDLETIPLSIRDAVEGVCETLAPNANKKGIKINIHIDPDIPDAVLGDQVRLRQILFNLGGNAVKFSDEGRVLIRAYKVPARAKKKVTVRFEIIDLGIGISKEAQSELFKEFSQAESSTTRRFGGTGLGLSISQRLVEMMKGKIEVESELGEGSTFIVTLTFPIAEKHEIKSDGHDLSGLNILFVGDDAEERELDAKYLRHWNAEVTTVGGIQEAKSLALEAAGEKKPFDIIALGSAWPLENRIAEIEAMQAEKVLAGTRFALMTETRIKAERKDLTNTVYIESDPLRRASFIRGVAVAAGRASPEVEYEEEVIDLSKIKVPTVGEALAAGTLILVAEDNPTNRDVIGRQLKLLGYAAEFRDDGKQALEAWRSKPYAMLLTDCHMPEMDGFELTQAIRKTEKDGGHRLPIIAITASALEAEVERCFEAGMDDFLAKPLEMPKLKAALKKWMPASASTKETDKKAPKKASKKPTAEKPPAKEVLEVGDGGGPIDPKALKSVFGDDEDTFREILQEFIEPATSNISDIEASFADRSADGVAKAAHKLKSSARSVGASELADLCLALETAGKAEDWSEIDEAAPRLSGVMKEIANYIEKL